MVASVGVNVTDALYVPVEPGTVDGVVNAKLPGTDAVPPLSVEADKASPRLIELALGQTETLGVACAAVVVLLTCGAAA